MLHKRELQAIELLSVDAISGLRLGLIGIWRNFILWTELSAPIVEVHLWVVK